jgi:hypothetical protein
MVCTILVPVLLLDAEPAASLWGWVVFGGEVVETLRGGFWW